MMYVKDRTWLECKITAEQWFPGKACAFVCNDKLVHPTLCCGCLMLGGPKEAHVHTGLVGGVLLEPGMWLVKRDYERYPECYNDEEFHKEFVEVPTPEDKK